VCDAYSFPKPRSSLIYSHPTYITYLFETGATPNAIRQRVSKIKNQAKAVLEGTGVDIAVAGSIKGGKGTPKKTTKSAATSGNDDDDNEEATTPATTPKKRAANGKGKGTPRSKKAKEEVKEEEDGANRDGSGEESPAKRMKIEEEDGFGEV
jgi:hypothetical protein